MAENIHYDTRCALSPAVVVAERIRRDAKPGGALAGLTFDETFEVVLDAPDTLPCITLIGLSDKSEIFGLQPQGASNLNTGQAQETTMIFQLRTDRTKGWLPKTRKTPDRSKWTAGDWMCELKDCIERNHDGVADSGMDYTCLKPVRMNVAEVNIGDVSITQTLEVILSHRGYCRASRSSTFREIVAASGLVLPE